MLKKSMLYGTKHRFWKVRCWKSARRYGRKQISKSKCTEYFSFGALLEVEILKNACRCGANTCGSHKAKSTTYPDHFCMFKGYFSLQAQWILHFLQMRKMWRLFTNCKKDDRIGRFEKDLQRYISRGKRNTKNIFVRYVRNLGDWFLEMGYILKY
jgi:hypothetical protein